MKVPPTNSLEHSYALLNFLIESNDFVAGSLVKKLGAQQLLSLIRAADWYPKDLQEHVHRELGEIAATSAQFNFVAALKRWRKRLAYAPDPGTLLDSIKRLDGGLLCPEDSIWPTQLDELGDGAPLCLWWRSTQPDRLGQQTVSRNVAIVGSRDSSDYGNQVTGELARGLVSEGICIVSGGAYGIDAAAHRAALQTPAANSAGAPTIAFLAGGLDRLYPAGNTSLLAQIIEHGVLLSEVPPGTAPARFRFLNRNRLIAAFCQLIVVTEARYRSGALNTARQALELGREVAAVPGSIFSPNSVGTHRLLRAGEAALISNVADALELIPRMDPVAAPQLTYSDSPRPGDGLNTEQLLIMDVLCRATPCTVDEICARSGLPVPRAISALRVLEDRQQARRVNSGWKRVGA